MFTNINFLEEFMHVLLVNPGHSQTFWSFDKVLEMTRKKALTAAFGLIDTSLFIAEATGTSSLSTGVSGPYRNHNGMNQI